MPEGEPIVMSGLRKSAEPGTQSLPAHASSPSRTDPQRSLARHGAGTRLHDEQPVIRPRRAVAIASLVVMPLLVRAKRKVARSINSAALRADAMQTQVCTYLSAILLGGLALNAGEDYIEYAKRTKRFVPFVV